MTSEYLKKLVDGQACGADRIGERADGETLGKDQSLTVWHLHSAMAALAASRHLAAASPNEGTYGLVLGNVARKFRQLFRGRLLLAGHRSLDFADDRRRREVVFFHQLLPATRLRVAVLHSDGRHRHRKGADDVLRD